MNCNENATATTIEPSTHRFLENFLHFPHKSHCIFSISQIIIFVMKQRQAFEYELKPNGEQERFMRKAAGSCRFVFNKALDIQVENHKAGNKYINYVSMAKQLTEWRNSPETSWLSEAPCHSLQHALKDLDRAFKNFFAKRANFPRLKKKGRGSSFRFPDLAQIKEQKKIHHDTTLDQILPLAFGPGNLQ